MNINDTMRELAEYIRMGEEVAANIEGLKNALKAHITKRGLDTLAGNEHKASYKAVASSRIDTAALKKHSPDVAAQYTKTTETRRFLFT